MAQLTRDQVERMVARGENLVGVDLSGAYLYRAGLSRANLEGANLSIAGLSRVNLEGANLTGATMPDGSEHE